MLEQDYRAAVWSVAASTGSPLTVICDAKRSSVSSPAVSVSRVPRAIRMDALSIGPCRRGVAAAGRGRAGRHNLVHRVVAVWAFAIRGSRAIAHVLLHIVVSVPRKQERSPSVRGERPLLGDFVELGLFGCAQRVFDT